MQCGWARRFSLGVTYAGGIIAGDLGLGELVLQIELHGVMGKGYGAGGGEMGVYSCDAGDEEIGFC